MLSAPHPGHRIHCDFIAQSSRNHERGIVTVSPVSIATPLPRVEWAAGRAAEPPQLHQRNHDNAQNQQTTTINARAPSRAERGELTLASAAAWDGPPLHQLVAAQFGRLGVG